MDEPPPSPSAPLEVGGASEPREPSVEPQWTHEIRNQVMERIGPFFSTAREYAFHPSRFGERWASGERFAMNPLWFAASAVAAMTTLETVFEEAVGERQRRTVLENALRTLAPYLYYVSIGLGAHLLLRAFGSRRRLASSIAMSLYAGGTMATLGQLLVLFTVGVFTVAQGPQWSEGPTPPALDWALTILLTLAFTAFYAVFGASMGALHRSPSRRSHATGILRVLLANGAAMLVSGLVCHYLPPPTMHLEVSVRRDGHWTLPEISASNGL